jgi:2-keto-3-deoxy-L-rhamnonate aldolase RhmA
MKLQPLRKRLRSEFLLGTFVTVHAPAIVEAMGPVGFDLLCLDAEHSAFGIAELEALIRAANIADVPAVVRVPDINADISRVLDLGAAGIVVPRVETVEQARDVVQRARYVPEGVRGVGAARANAYGMEIQPYLAGANDSLLVIVQIETAKGLEAVEEIAAVPGIDGLCIGPGDLSVSIGHQAGSPVFEQAIQRICKAAKQSGIAPITVSGTAAEVNAAREAGFSMVFFSAERFFLMQAWHEALGGVTKPSAVTAAA